MHCNDLAWDQRAQENNHDCDKGCKPGWQSKKYCSRLSAKNHNQRNIVDSWRNICPCWRQNIVAILFCQRHINWDIRSVVENDRWWFGGFTKICSSTETQKTPHTSKLQNSTAGDWTNISSRRFFYFWHSQNIRLAGRENQEIVNFPFHPCAMNAPILNVEQKVCIHSFMSRVLGNGMQRNDFIITGNSLI